MLAMLSTRPAVRRCAGASALTLALLGAGLPAAAADRPQPDLSRFYRQKPVWGACEGPDMPKDLQCARVTVPLDYARPGAGTLDLALARYRATGTSQGSVLLNFGGPGGAGISELASGGRQFMDLTNGYDVVTFDPRGVGRSSPVSCGEGSEEASLVTEEHTDIGHPQALFKQLRQAADLCARNSGPVLPHIGTINASRDMDVIRQALGDSKLNYLGFSYGTRLGAVYAAQFPGKVGRITLDGVDTLTESLAEQGVAGAEGQQTALDDFLDWCTTDIGCPFGQDRRMAGDGVLRLVRSLDENPVPTGFGGSLSGQDLVGAIGQALYSKELWPSLERALVSLVEDGDARRVLAFSTGGVALPGDRRRTDGGLVDAEDVPADNLSSALMAINCADDPDRPTATRLAKDLTDLRSAYDQASPVFGRYRLTQLLMCYGRPKGTDFIRDRVKDVHSAKMLLVGTRGDPATPYRWTEETARRLGSSAVVLDNKGEGHTGYSSSKCVHRKVNDFLLYGTLPPGGGSCPADAPADRLTSGGSG
ncbi:alpha/beta fold hydrolase [Streptomyces sp. 5-8]|uniref:Alpha/beta fold hydrolase n=1 Tax=Streptomyces musisoli TaxID=2802280 RepID=A0ABS1P9C8_9ACTN|nr:MULTISPECIES: alpha/beta hydrolase [Streptomyces]MBL1108979.1 alpha/beta fold hydrolase [Streptomyces musisoli]MBY8845777.1 alpha/beta hydrolase [Streptomyces sp. SP2-10]